MIGAKTFVIGMLGMTAALTAASIAFNAAVDPYALQPARAGKLDEAQGRRGALPRMAAYAEHARARTVILGNSRAQSGLAASHAGFDASLRPVVNLALGGSSIEQIRLLLAHAHASTPVRLAVVGLDLESFLDAGRTDFDPALLRGNDLSAPRSAAWLRIHTSLSTLNASIRQRFGLASGDDAALDDTRRPNDADGALEDSQRSIVWATEFHNFHSRLPKLFPAMSADPAWSSDPARRQAMASFAQLLRFARHERIDLKLFISPVHARYLDWYRRVGWWSLYDEWKRALVAEIAEEAGSGHGGRPYVLWDLSGFRGPAAEAVPRLKDTTSRMHWYLETSHYHPRLGARILDVVLGRTVADDAWPVAQIDARNVNDHLRRLYRDADSWRAENPGEMGNVAEMVGFLRRMTRR